MPEPDSRDLIDELADDVADDLISAWNRTYERDLTAQRVRTSRDHRITVTIRLEDRT